MKVNLNLKIIILLNIWMKQKLNVFYKFEHKNKIKFFSNDKLKFNLEPKS